MAEGGGKPLEEFQRRWDELGARVAAQKPSEMTVEQIDAEITKATDELWAERRAARRRSDRLAREL